MKDLMSLIDVKRAIAATSVADNTAQVGQVIDRQGFNSLTYVINTGVLADADATFVTLLEESDAPGGPFTPVADQDLIGTEALASFDFSADNKLFKLGYIGAKRYTRLTITPANNAGAAALAAVAVLGHPALAPTPNPPV